MRVLLCPPLLCLPPPTLCPHVSTSHLCGTMFLPQPQLTLSDLGRAAPTVL